jgi:hypothetical protein
MHLHAFGQQSFPSALTAPGERGSAALGFHARTKAMLAFARAFGWLVRTFHKTPLGAIRERLQ